MYQKRHMAEHATSVISQGSHFVGFFQSFSVNTKILTDMASAVPILVDEFGNLANFLESLKNISQRQISQV